MSVILGNHARREKILNDAKNKTLPHALLISGPTGIGKFKFLKYLASQILQKEKSAIPELVIVDKLYMEGGKYSLEELAQSSTFDQGDRKRKKKRTDSIGVDDLEKFTKHLHETVDGEHKIVLIRDMERMTREASNKFLKILEEPPVKTMFLLTTSAERKLLPTVISRTRREYFSLVPCEQMKDFLYAEGKNISPSEQEQLLQISNGRGELLQTMMNDEQFFTEEKEKAQLAKDILSLSALGKMNEAEVIAKKPVKEIEDFLCVLEGIFRKKLREKNNKNESEVFIITALENIHRALVGLRKNGNKRMVLEEVFLGL